MYKQIISISILLSYFSCSPPESELYHDVQIARDIWGVPHIKGKTDKDVVYGLAWAQCEDDFITLQEQLLAAKGMLGEIKGKDGLIIDFGVKFMGLREEVDKRIEDIDFEHTELIQNYINAVNNFAAIYPEEVLLQDAFPLTVEDALVGFLMGMANISGADAHLQKILTNKLPDTPPSGSNAIAISGKKTDSGKPFLAINSHQPLEGWYSWYEAHLYSDEGLNILGGTFPGGLMVFHGVNEHLGWAQTVNAADFTDVYQLRMHESKEDHYYFDDEILMLEENSYWSWMKVAGPIKIPIRQKNYQSVYGPTFKTEQGVFAWRTTATRDVRLSQQWFAMNKAKNFTEFKEALSLLAIPSTNIVYADKEDNIFYISNARLPKRNHNYDWSGILPGDTSATLWEEDYLSISDLPQVENPESGYVFNTNNSPFNATAPEDDTDQSQIDVINGFLTEDTNNNRSAKFLSEIKKIETLSYQDFKNIKYNTTYPDSLQSPYILNLELILNLNPDDHPEIDDAIRMSNQWNRDTKIDNTSAAFFSLNYKALENALKEEDRFIRGQYITEVDVVKSMTKAKDIMLSKYGRIDVPLGDIQRHIRGDVNLPLQGGPDVLAAMYMKETDNNQYKGIAGESYIALVQFGPDGPIIETVNAYGSSAEPDSPHYTDQMDLFVKQQLKPMSLDIDKAIAEADTVYFPMRIVKN